MIGKIKKYLKDNSGDFFYSTKSYAQEGEDVVLKKIVGNKKTGFYVEVGCHHPFRFSNTYLFYKRGWSGLCIDPLPGIKKQFNKWRPRDIIIEKGVAAENGVLKYYMFNEPALNTFDKDIAQTRIGGKYNIIKTVEIETKRLSQILKDYYPEANKEIDFFSIDVEGLDLPVLESNDWAKYRPRLIVAECLNNKFDNLRNDPVSIFLSKQGYNIYAKTDQSVIFKTEKI